MRIVSTDIRYRDPDNWMADDEFEDTCCDPGSAPPCREKVEEWHGYTEDEILAKLGIELDETGRDANGHRVVIRRRGVQKTCGKKITRMVVNQKACCANVEPLAWDEANSASVIPAGQDGVVSVTGGKPPYTWEVATGIGFWLAANRSQRTLVTEYPMATVYLEEGTACGTGRIEVTDACGYQATCEVRSDAGEWVQIWYANAVNNPDPVCTGGTWGGTCGVDGRTNQGLMQDFTTEKISGRYRAVARTVAVRERITGFGPGAYLVPESHCSDGCNNVFPPNCAGSDFVSCGSDISGAPLKMDEPMIEPIVKCCEPFDLCDEQCRPFSYIPIFEYWVYEWKCPPA